MRPSLLPALIGNFPLPRAQLGLDELMPQNATIGYAFYEVCACATPQHVYMSFFADRIHESRNHFNNSTTTATA